MFADNKYYAWYMAITSRAQRLSRANEYTERHHILPKSLGGGSGDDNLVRLTFREHFLCHWLLVKCTHGVAKQSMWLALSRMRTSYRGRVVSSWQYAIARAALRKAMIGNTINNGRVSAFKGKRHTPESKRKLALVQLGRKKTAAQIEAMRLRLLGNKHRKGIPHSVEVRARMSMTRKGVKKSAEQVAKRVATVRRNRLVSGQLEMF